MVHDDIELSSAVDIQEISEYVEADDGGTVTEKFMINGVRLPDVFKRGNSDLGDSLALAHGAL